MSDWQAEVEGGGRREEVEAEFPGAPSLLWKGSRLHQQQSRTFRNGVFPSLCLVTAALGVNISVLAIFNSRIILCLSVH